MRTPFFPFLCIYAIPFIGYLLYCKATQYHRMHQTHKKEHEVRDRLLADKKLHFILSYEGGFKKPTVFKINPPFLQDYSICNKARIISTQFLLHAFDPNEWCLKDGLHSGGLNPRPLSHESSALSTRPRLLTD